MASLLAIRMDFPSSSWLKVDSMLTPKVPCLAALMAYPKANLMLLGLLATETDFLLSLRLKGDSTLTQMVLYLARLREYPKVSLMSLWMVLSRAGQLAT